ncbi:hypothetical protein ABZ905_37065 [Streptomyces parvus]|uniref:hypothetical protein n=1 Tax=Streptomyces parvus TaxID=66428 RepID=UPI0033EBC721
MVYSVKYTEDAAAVRDAMIPDRRALLEKGMEKLAEDPFTPVSQPVSGDDVRAVAIASGLTVDYMVHRTFVVIIAVVIFDQTLI